jgi:hypothetical protein
MKERGNNNFTDLEISRKQFNNDLSDCETPKPLFNAKEGSMDGSRNPFQRNYAFDIMR